MTTTVTEQVTEIECGFWESAADPTYYDQNMDEQATMVIEPMGFLSKKDAVNMAKEAEGWSDFKMHDLRVTQLTPDCVTIAYHGQATSTKTGMPYRASINSVYVQHGNRWLLGMTSHQPWSENHDIPRD